MKHIPIIQLLILLFFTSCSKQSSKPEVGNTNTDTSTHTDADAGRDADADAHTDSDTGMGGQPNFVWIMSEDNSKHFLEPFDEHGTPVPNITQLGEEGLVFRNAFSNAPVCSTARTTLITGCFGPRIGSQYHRKETDVTIPMPDNLKPFPQILREAGYYTTNNHKKDYNVNIVIEDVWNASSDEATWRNRDAGQPFFHVQTYSHSHEGNFHFMGISGDTNTDQGTVFIPPIHPDTPLFRYTYAKYHDAMVTIDEKVGAVLDALKRDGLLTNTFVFYFSDNGGVLPGSKGYLFDTGLHVPLVVRIPEAYRESLKIAPGTSVDGFVSFVDYGATLLHLAGIEIPDEMDGKPFLGRDISLDALNSRKTTFSYGDRFDEKYDMVRALRQGKYKYIRNYQPFNFDGLYNAYRYRMDAYQEWRAMYDNGELHPEESRFFEKKAPEALYDMETDPYETNNLAGLPDYDGVLTSMRDQLTDMVKEMPDLSFFPESELIQNGYDNPVAFGQASKEEIEQLVDIANLSLSQFDTVASDVESALHSENPWHRYWGLIVCSSHMTTAPECVDRAANLATDDGELLVRVRAAEYLALIGEADPEPVIKDALAQAGVPTEALLILNTVVMLMDGKPGYALNITASDLHADTSSNELVQLRLEYISSRIQE